MKSLNPMSQFFNWSGRYESFPGYIKIYLMNVECYVRLKKNAWLIVKRPPHNDNSVTGNP